MQQEKRSGLFTDIERIQKKYGLSFIEKQAAAVCEYKGINIVDDTCLKNYRDTDIFTLEQASGLINKVVEDSIKTYIAKNHTTNKEK